jgi:hypothetical protein
MDNAKSTQNLRDYLRRCFYDTSGKKPTEGLALQNWKRSSSFHGLDIRVVTFPLKLKKRIPEATIYPSSSISIAAFFGLEYLFPWFHEIGIDTTDIEEKEKVTILREMADNGYYSELKALVDSGILGIIEGPMLIGALMTAIYRSDIDIAEYLVTLERIDIDYVDKSSSFLLGIAIRLLQGAEEETDISNAKAIIECLTGKGATVAIYLGEDMWPTLEQLRKAHNF